MSDREPPPRLVPPSGEINPYASPIIPDPPLPFADAGVGAWRDGNLLVIHREAPLPAICIRSGLPADAWCPLKIKWSYGFGQPRLRMTMNVPLSRDWVYWHQRGPTIMFAVAAILALCAVGTFPLWSGLEEEAWFVVAFALLTPAGACVIIGITFKRLLEFKRVKGNYFWFTGANQKFLEQLPMWRFGKS
jgi:hypothetical protein